MGIYRRKDSPYYWYSFRIEGRGRIIGSTETADRKLAGQIYVAKRSQYQKVGYGFERPTTKLSQLFEDYITLYAKHNKRTWESNVSGEAPAREHEHGAFKYAKIVAHRFRVCFRCGRRGTARLHALSEAI